MKSSTLMFKSDELPFHVSHISDWPERDRERLATWGCCKGKSRLCKHSLIKLLIYQGRTLYL